MPTLLVTLPRAYKPHICVSCPCIIVQIALLVRSGYRDVVWAKNGVEAIEAFERRTNVHALRLSSAAAASASAAAAASGALSSSLGALVPSSSSLPSSLVDTAMDAGTGAGNTSAAVAAVSSRSAHMQSLSPFGVVLSE